MRHIAILLTLAGPAFADEASDLFYRAFWLEQSGGDVAEAEKLYREVVDKHAKAPEAPRAFLAIIRLRAARGEKVDHHVAKLALEYPGARKEIEEARRIAARQNTAFDAQVGPDDSPLERKLKTVYRNLVSSGKLHKTDADFLADVGAAAHPMLAAALRSTEDGAVYEAAKVLLGQDSEEADGVLIRSLEDDSVLYRLRILDAFLLGRALRVRLVDALADLWPRASRSMRLRMTKVWGQQTRVDGPVSTRCYTHLATALRDDDDQVRMQALAVDPNPPYVRPAVWAKEAMKLLPSSDPRARTADSILPWQLAHDELRPALEKKLIEREERLSVHWPGPEALDEAGMTEEMARSWARIALARSARDPSILDGKGHSPVRYLVQYAATVSDAAVIEMVRAALERGSRPILSHVGTGLQVRDKLGRERPRALPQFVPQALRLCYAEEKDVRLAAAYFFHYFPLRAEDLPKVRAAAKEHAGTGLPAAAVTDAFVRAIGPEKAASLVPVAMGEDISVLMKRGLEWEDPASELVFWKAIVPRTTAEHAGLLRQLAGGDPAFATLVARRLLDARGKEWEWRTSPGQVHRYNVGGPEILAGVRNALSGPELKPALYAAADDERHEIARYAIRVASDDPSEDALAAHRAAMKSPWPDIREYALKSLAERGAEGAALLAELLRDPEFPDAQRKHALTAFSRAAGPAEMPYVGRRLDARPEGYEASVMWGLAFTHDRKATVDRAFREVFGDGPKDYRDEALDVLRRTSDERRIPVFRKVLREGGDEDRVHRVLNTVADQYLIELGPEVLLHLRNPDDGIRNTATKAIERLRFYAEAKKLFEGE